MAIHSRGYACPRWPGLHGGAMILFLSTAVASSSSYPPALRTIRRCDRWGLKGIACAPAFPFLTATAGSCAHAYHYPSDEGGGALGCARRYGLLRAAAVLGGGDSTALAHFALVGASLDVPALLPLGLASVALRTSPPTLGSARVARQMGARAAASGEVAAGWLAHMRQLLDADAGAVAPGSAAREAAHLLRRVGLYNASAWWPDNDDNGERVTALRGPDAAVAGAPRRIAVLLSGALRALHLTHANLRRNVLDGLAPGEYDVFLFAEDGAYATKRLETISTVATRAVLASFERIDESVLAPAVALSFVLEALQPGRLQVFLQQLHCLKRVNEMRKAHEAFELAEGETYAALLYVREDALYASAIPSHAQLLALLARLELELELDSTAGGGGGGGVSPQRHPSATVPILCLPSFAAYPLNDRFAFGRPAAMDIYFNRIDALVASTEPFPHNSEGFLDRVLLSHGGKTWPLPFKHVWFDIVRGSAGDAATAEETAETVPSARPRAHPLRVASSSLWSCAAACQEKPRGVTSRIAGNFGTSRVLEVEADGRSGRETRFWPTLVADCAGGLRTRLLSNDIALHMAARNGKGGVVTGATDGTLCVAFWPEDGEWGVARGERWRLEVEIKDGLRALGNVTIIWTTPDVVGEEYAFAARGVGGEWVEIDLSAAIITAATMRDPELGIMHVLDLDGLRADRVRVESESDGARGIWEVIVHPHDALPFDPDSLPFPLGWGGMGLNGGPL